MKKLSTFVLEGLTDEVKSIKQIIKKLDRIKEKLQELTKQEEFNDSLKLISMISGLIDSTKESLWFSIDVSESLKKKNLDKISVEMQNIYDELDDIDKSRKHLTDELLDAMVELSDAIELFKSKDEDEYADED